MAFWNKAKHEDLERLARQGALIREMMQHPAHLIIEDRLAKEFDWVRAEWALLLEQDTPDLASKQLELRAYIKALQLMEFIFIGLPKAGWRAEDKLLAFANRNKTYTLPVRVQE